MDGWMDGKGKGLLLMSVHFPRSSRGERERVVLYTWCMYDICPWIFWDGWEGGREGRVLAMIWF